MKIYRIENDEGWGAWSAGEPWALGLDDLLDGEFFGSNCSVVFRKGDSVPTRSPLWMYINQFRFGCTDIDSLIEYFGSCFAVLIAQGFRIAEYNIHKSHVRFGEIGNEVAFLVDKVKERRIIL